MTTPLAILTFILGAAIASFSSVVISRLHTREKGLLLGRSKCPHCHKQLKPTSLVPILSYIFQRGYCSMCEQKISPHYLLIELFFAIIFTITFYKFAPHLNPTNLLPFIFNIIIFSFLGLIFFYDLKYKEIPDQLSLPAILIALAYNFATQSLSPTEILLGTASIGGFFLLQYLISKGRIIGGGDIRLGALMGAFLGFKLGLTALALAYIAGGIIATYLLLTHRAKAKTEIAFGPFLTLATILVALYGTEILNFYFQTILGIPNF